VGGIALPEAACASSYARNPVRHTSHTAIAFLMLCASACADVVISEFLAVNDGGLVDQDGATSDWIELTNTGVGAVNLAGWTLTNQAAVPGLWTFPSVSLSPGGRLVIFASGKNRVNPAAELHTSFTLEADGEYLGLFQPGGVLASEFAPVFPQQRADFSFGVAHNVTDEIKVMPTSAAKWLVPANGTLGTDWTNAGFDDGGWTNVQAAVGFQSSATGPLPQGYWSFDDTSADGAGNAPVTINGAAFSAAVPAQIGSGKSLAFSSADGDFASVAIDVSEATYSSSFWFRTSNPNAGLWSVVGQDLGADGHDRHVYLIGGNIAARVWSDETIASTGKAYANGQWHHVTHVFPGAPGSGQRLYVDGVLVASGAKAQSDFNWQQHVNIGFSNDAASQYLNGEIDEAAVWNVALTQAQAQTLASGASPLALAGLSPYVKTNVSGSLLGVNATAYLRVPFTMTRPGSDYEQVSLRVRFEDGFIAYLNGMKVASRNAPASPDWNSTASSDRAVSAAVVVESIDLTAFKGLLVAGSNVLAVQVLNSAARTRNLP